MSKVTLDEVLCYEEGLREGKRRAAKDKARLDWMQKHPLCCRYDDTRKPEFSFMAYDGTKWHFAKTLRAAIDKAMKGEKKK